MNRYKYPRTFHLSSSPGKTSDDKTISDMSACEGERVVITEKMDGESCTIYSDGFTHARSIDSKFHPSRSWVKNLASSLDFTGMGEDIRLCGENMYAKHSIYYKDLKSYFYLFGVWTDNICQPWGITKQIAEVLNVELVPVLYEGIYDPLFLAALPSSLRDDQEGFVIRRTGIITLKDWPTHVAKWVRPNHVQTDKHWMYQEMVKNILDTP